MTAPTSREPGYRAGRFFLSPMLGCTARCAFCYIFSFGYRYPKGVENEYGIEASLDWIIRHPAFEQGPSGSIISIGAWGDPFPPQEEVRQGTLRWIDAACGLGNPVQLMSRFELPPKLVDAVVATIRYEGQLLYSTSLSTIAQASTVEKFADTPHQRLATLSRFRARGVPVNVMVKPFILGLTDRETEEILSLLRTYNVEVCVVGELYWDARIERATVAVAKLGPDATQVMDAEIDLHNPLDCEPSAPLHSLSTRHLDSFISQLWAGGVAAFKKSACVNSYTSGIDLGLRDRPEYQGYCVECGMCAGSARTAVAPLLPGLNAQEDSSGDERIVVAGLQSRWTASLHGSASDLLTRWRPLDSAMSELRDSFLGYLTAHEDAMTRSSSPAHLTSSIVVIDPSMEQVLLVFHRKAGRWLQPGGHCEPQDATLPDAAMREAREETGVQQLRLSSPEPVDLDIHDAPCRPNDGISHYDVRFVGLAPYGAVSLNPREALAVRWFPFEELPEDLDADTRRLIAQAQASVAAQADADRRPPG